MNMHYVWMLLWGFTTGIFVTLSRHYRLRNKLRVASFCISVAVISFGVAIYNLVSA